MTKTLIQCDFDGTVTEADISFLLLDLFAGRNWRDLFQQYQDGKITVGRFNELAFGMVKASRKELLSAVRDGFAVRRGFADFVTLCRRRNFRFVIVSNGLDFYIEEILKRVGLADIEFHAARTTFLPRRLEVKYISPGGEVMDSDFKDAYTSLFLSQGYRVVYIGNGASDLAPARRCHYIFATDSLLKQCRRDGVNCMPFTDFIGIIEAVDVVR